MNENLAYGFSILLENVKRTEIAFFFESKIHNPKSCLNEVFGQTLGERRARGW
jgi:hypothetical protein